MSVCMRSNRASWDTVLVGAMGRPKVTKAAILAAIDLTRRAGLHAKG
jgi:hypothetical protein